jgi:signal transduction histidine kinase
MIARLEAGSAGEILAPLDLGAAVREVGDLYEALAEDQGLVLDVQAEDGLIIAGNRELVGQALANLIDNALKYGAAGERADSRVAVEAWRAGEVIHLAVSDQGPGIPEADRGRVLGRFVRLEEARSRPGFGLGLSLVNAVIRLHQGTVRLADNGPGLRVEISIPAQAGAAPATSADVLQDLTDDARVPASPRRAT